METATEAFDARIDLLAGELELAIKWERPSILLAIYASEFVRIEAQTALAEQIREFGATVSSYTVSGEEDADIPRALAQYPDREETVFFVSGLRWGGGKDGRNAYRALNLRREYFVEYRIRAVFWLTESEAAMLPRTAPDFWAFRHRAVEFVEAPKPKQIAPVAQVLAWTDWSSRTLEQDTDAKIALRAGLLQDLPESDETLAARADLLYTLGTLYDAKQEYDRALKHHKQALSIFKRLGDTKRQSWTRNSLGNIYHNLGRYEEAEAAYRKAIDLDPENAYPWNNLGTVYHNLGRHADAEAAYRQAIDLDPDYAAPWNNLGSFYGQQGRHEEAEAAYRKAIDLDPEFAYPWNGLGNVYDDLGHYADAKAAYRKAIDLDPEFAYAYANLADILTNSGNYNEAIKLYTKSAQLEPRAKPYIGLSTVYRTLGRYEDAEDAFNQALDLDPEDAVAHGSLTAVLRKLGREEEAEEHLTRARELMANESEYNKACIEAIAGNAEAALAHLERALAQVPGDRGWAARDPDLEPLHGHPRFEVLVGGETKKSDF